MGEIIICISLHIDEGKEGYSGFGEGKKREPKKTQH